jgi:hypothetical protein
MFYTQHIIGNTNNLKSKTLQREIRTMNDNLKRDTTGKCTIGQCRDRALEGQQERQGKIVASRFQSEESYPSPPGASFRNEPPGFLGGHV